MQPNMQLLQAIDDAAADFDALSEALHTAARRVSDNYCSMRQNAEKIAVARDETAQTELATQFIQTSVAAQAANHFPTEVRMLAERCQVRAATLEHHAKAVILQRDG